MAIISEQLNQRSLVALIACDQSYATELQLTADRLFPASGGTKLTSFADSGSPGNEPSAQMFTNAGLASFEDSFGGEPARGTGDWKLHAKRYDATTGFSVLVFYSVEKNEYIVSLTGTNGKRPAKAP